MFLKTNKPAQIASDTSTNTKKGAPSVLSSEVHLLGNLVSDGTIDSDGSVEGNVKAHQVTVRSNGRIKGDIVADTVFVHGEVHGMIRAKTVHLHATCHVEGVIMYASLTIEDGAFVDGKFKRNDSSANTKMSMSDDDGIIEMPASGGFTVLENLRLTGS